MTLDRQVLELVLTAMQYLHCVRTRDLRSLQPDAGAASESCTGDSRVDCMLK